MTRERLIGTLLVSALFTAMHCGPADGDSTAEWPEDTEQLELAAKSTVQRITTLRGKYVSYDATNAYVSAGSGLYKVNLATGYSSILTNEDGIDETVSDGTYVFYEDENDDEIRRVRISTKTDELFSRTDGIARHDGLKLFSDKLYWADDRGLVRQPKASPFPTVLYDGVAHALLLVDTRNMYFVQGVLSTTRTSGGGAAVVLYHLYAGVSGSGGWPTAQEAEDDFSTFIEDSGYLYWYRIGEGLQRVRKWSGTLQTIVPTGISEIRSMCATSDSIYYVQETPNILGWSGTIRRYDKHTGKVFVKYNVSDANFLHCTPGYLFWQDEGGLKRAPTEAISPSW